MCVLLLLWNTIKFEFYSSTSIQKQQLHSQIVFNIYFTSPIKTKVLLSYFLNNHI